MQKLVVAAAVIEKNNAVLVTRRLAGTHLGGRWEFPGGKCEPQETIAACITRELREELGVAVDVGREVFATTHEYEDRIVELHFLDCVLLGEPVALLGQEMRWVSRERLAELEFPPADAELIVLLSGPTKRMEAP